MSILSGSLLAVLLAAGLFAAEVPVRAGLAGVPVAAAVAEAPDEASAARLAYRIRKPVLVTSLTTEISQTWAQPDGTFRVSTAVAPVRTRDESGAWVDIDLTLQQRPDGSVAPRRGVGDLWLSGARSASSEALAAVGEGAARTTLGWSGALPAPVLDGPKATYRQVEPGVDLVVEARRT